MIKTIESEITDFLIKHGEGLYKPSERNMIENFIAYHINYGTLMTVRENGAIVAAVRWNWLDRKTAKILDLVIHPKFRNKAMLRHMLLQATKAMPQLETIAFHKKKLGQNRLFSHNIIDFIGGFHGKR